MTYGPEFWIGMLIGQIVTIINVSIGSYIAFRCVRKAIIEQRKAND